MKNAKGSIKEKSIARRCRMAAILIVMTVIFTVPAYATGGDPVAAVNNLSNFAATLISAAGGIIILFGVVQFGMGFMSHDPSQKSNGILILVGGIIIACAPAIVRMIQGSL